jgi:hypothetical protein
MIVKRAVFAPLPRASVTIATAVHAFCFARPRTATLMS